MSPVITQAVLPLVVIAAIGYAATLVLRWLRPRRTAIETALGRPTPHTPALRLTRRLLPPPVLVGVGAVACAASTFLSWTWDPGFPGDLTIVGNPGGNQVLALLVAVVALLLLLAHLHVPGARWLAPRGAAQPLRLLGLGALGVTGYTVGAISYDLGGTVNVDPGGWIAVGGSLLLLVGALFLPWERPAPGAVPRQSAPLEMLVIVLGLVVVLITVSYGVQTASTEAFIAYLITVGFVAGALSSGGLIGRFGTYSRRHRIVSAVASFAAAFAFPFTQNGNDTYTLLAVTIMVFGTTALGLNIVVGLAGLLDLGYVAFLGVGAYTAALLSGSAYSTIHVQLPFVVTVFVGIAVAAVVGVLIGAPTLRLRGDYLAIVTLGFGEIFHIAALNLNGISGPSLTNGPNGIPGVPDLVVGRTSWFGGLDFVDPHTWHLGGASFVLSHFGNYYLLMLVFLVVVIGVFSRVNNSRIGRAWVAIREDEIAASAMGINTFRLKLLAFALGASLAGFAGTVDAHVISTVTPDQFQFIDSTFLLAAVVMGGMGTIPGPLLGSALLLLLPEKLRFFQEYRLLLFGLALILTMRFRPEGIVPSTRRRLEFHEHEPTPGEVAGALGPDPEGPERPGHEGLEGTGVTA